MTHNIIHDEEKIGEIINDIPYELLSEMKYGDDNMIIEAMKQYAEHTLVKFIDSIMVDIPRANDTKEMHECQCGNPITCSQWNDCREKILANIQSLKAQLIKSKPVDNSQEKDNK